MKGHIPTWLWGAIVVAGVMLIGFLDYLTGYELNFFVFYFVPVALAAWFLGLGASVAVSFLSSVVWLGADVLTGSPHSSYFYAVWNTIIRLASFVVTGSLTFRIRQLIDRERRLVEDLRQSISEVRVLEAFLPICSQCKKIRNQGGSWQQLEVYISEHSDTQFSHGYCPECAKKVMEEAGLLKK
jgi:hypothetical protein